MRNFYEFVKKYNFTLNNEKSVVSVTEINMLGYLISHGNIKPDPDRMKPLNDLPVPNNAATLKRTLGMFSYYSQWVPRFSDKICPLTNNPDFPLSKEAIQAFNDLKRDIAKASLSSPNETDLLVLETDASQVALSACLNQNGRPIAFFSRTLQAHEKKHHIVEKEAAAIVESVRKWRHYLTGRKFKVITDQEAVFFIFNISAHGKTKNNKIQRWRVDLSCFEYDIQYRPGSLNVTADCLSRVDCASSYNSNLDKLKELHDGLCHPGISRMGHYVRSKNLPYSISDVKSVVAQCRTCAVIKPRFYKPNNPPLIKATQPFERLSIDFKGPLPSVTNNKYILTIVDEFSRFTFAYPSKDMTAATVIQHLSNLFSVFGLASYIHSDNGPSLICNELRDFLMKVGIAYSNAAIYNPRGNGQCERYNGIVCKSIELACKSKGIPNSYWEEVLPVALHSLRSLLCVATNQTPHERLFNYQRRSASGHTLPSWLLKKGTVLLRKHTRRSKYDPICEEVELIDLTPTYAKVQMPSGRETTVSLRDLAPVPNLDPNVMENNVDSESPTEHLIDVESAYPVLPPQAKDSHQKPNTSVSIDKELFSRSVFKNSAPTVAFKPAPVPLVAHSNSDVTRTKYGRISKQPNSLNYETLGGDN